MSDLKTLHLNLHWAEIKPQSDGTVDLTIGGASRAGVGHKIVFTMAPSTIGYIAADMHRAVAELQKTLDEVKAQLRGGA